MLSNLKAEIARKDLKTEDIAKALDVNEKTVRNKISGITPFTFPESLVVRDSFFPELDIEYLFRESQEKPEQTA